MRPPAAIFAVAWHMLADRPVRSICSALGVGFAAFVMFAELGFFRGITDSSAGVARLLACDLVVSHPQKDHLKSGEMFAFAHLRRLRDIPGVTAAVPLSASGAYWWNPATGHRNRVLLLGVHLDDPLLDVPGLAAHTPALRLPGGVLFDARSRPELGHIVAGMRARIDGTAVRIAGFFTLGSNFTYEGHVLAGAATFRTITGQPENHLDLGLVRLAPGADLPTVRALIRARLGAHLLVLTPAEILAREERFTIKRTPTGIVFALGLALGLVIGTAVCYQILFHEVHDHLRQFAMLRALGHPPASLSWIVALEAVLLGTAGCVMAVVASHALYAFVESRTSLPLTLTTPRVAFVCALVAVACALAGWRAVARAHTADPAELY